MSDHDGQPVHRVRVGILGCGNVGAPLVDLIQRGRDEIAAHEPACSSKSRPSPFAARRRSAASTSPPGVLTTDAAAVVDDPSIDVIVEVIGGIEPARS